MVSVRFVDSVLRGLKPRKLRFDIQDPQKTGLLLRVSPQGRKTWMVSFRSANGVKLQRPIGNFPAMSVAQARDAVQAEQNGAAESND